MRVFRVAILAAISFAALTSGCSRSPDFVATEEPWRADEERACLASGVVRETPYLQSRAALGGPSLCGALSPFQMAAASQGRVLMRPPAMLRCPMIPQVDRWVQDIVEPAAHRHLRANLVEITVAASYSCRARNHVFGAKLSEHGYANALDVSAFSLDDGRKVHVKSGWHGDDAERAFLKAIHAGACRSFTTVLGPDADANHHDHFHLDMARHNKNNSFKVCK